MADSTYSGDATIIDGTAVSTSTGSADVIGGVYNDSASNLGSGTGGFIRLTTARAVHVNLRDASGNAVATGTQYTEDAAMGAVGSAIGTLLIGRASASVPTSVADADAVGLWASRFGALNVIIRDTSGAAAATGTQYTEDGAITANAGVGTLVIARRDDALSTLTPAADDAVGLRVGDKGALWVQISDGSGNQITSFGGGTQYVEDAALGAVGSATGTLHIARASAAMPTNVSADADAVALWALRSGALAVQPTAGGALIAGSAAFGQYTDIRGINGATPSATVPLFVELSTGAGAYTLFGQAIGSAPWTRVTDGTTTVGVIAGSTALKTDLSSIAGTVPGATAFVPARLTDGTAYYTKTGQTAGTAAYAQLSDQTNTVGVIAASNSLKTDTSAWGGTAVTAAAALSDTNANPTTGLLGTANLLWNTTNWERWRSVVGLGDAATTGIASSSNFVYNGTNWDRARAVLGVTAGANTDLGIQAAGVGPGFARIPANASLTSGQSATISTKGAGTVTFDVTGTFSGITSVWEATTDDSNWFAIKLINLSTGAQESNGPAAAAGGRWSLGEVSRYRQVRLRLTAYSTGPVVVAMTANPMPRYMATEGDVSHDQADDGSPIKVGGYAKATAPTAVADADRVNAWFSTYGMLNVTLRDTTGGYVTAGGGTQYVEDAALGAVGSATGTLHIARASAAMPTNVSADADAVAMWALRSGALVVQPSAGGALIAGSAAFGQYADIRGINGATPSATVPLFVELSTGAGAYTLFGQAIGSAPWTRVTDGTTTAGVIAGTTALKTDMSSIAGTATVTGGVNGTLGVGGTSAAAATDGGNPVKVGGYASAAAPTAVTAGQRANAWFDLNGRLVTTPRSPTGTMTSVAAAVADTSLLAANTSRLGFTVHNDSTAICYLLVATGTASTTVFSVKMAAGGYYEAPPLGYTGQVRGYWAAANGSARITEYT